MKLLPFLICTFLLFSLNTKAQETETDDFEAYKKQQQEAFQQYQQEVTAAYEAYAAAEAEGLQQLKDQIARFWSTGDIKLSTPKTWVDYAADKKERSVVDFEKGEATIELILEPDESENKQETIEKVKQAIEKLITNQGKTKDFSTELEKPATLQAEPVLKDQITNEQGQKVNSENAAEFAETLAKRIMAEQKQQVTGADGKTRDKLTVSIPLAPDHIRTRAAKFEDHISHYANHYQLSPALVYAVIHTESYFNPKATSHAPAYGLMQLVPKSGARDAYLYVYKEDKLLTANYLYQPDKNIELGTAYLQLLMNRYFKKVENEESRLLCAIAAYNTGAGNVARAFSGTTNPAKAIPKINEMPFEAVYGYLREYLPYEETRDYIRKVSQRMRQYESWTKNF